MRNEKYLAELKNNKELATKEYAKCIESNEYFYNMCCKREGDPDYSSKVFEEYKKLTEENRRILQSKFRRVGPKPNFEYMRKFYENNPFSPKESFRLIIKQ
jgi:hypothetical protein